jgi:hypothetical protein
MATEWKDWDDLEEDAQYIGSVKHTKKKKTWKQIDADKKSIKIKWQKKKKKGKYENVKPNK